MGVSEKVKDKNWYIVRPHRHWDWDRSRIVIKCTLWSQKAWVQIFTDCVTLYSSVQFSRSVVFDTLQPRGLQHTRHPCPSPIPWIAQTHVHWIGDAVQPSHPLSSPSPPLTSIRVFSNESALHIRWPKYWSFSFSISPSNEYSRLISFRIECFDFLESKGLSSLSTRQFISINYFMLGFLYAQVSQPYMSAGKTIGWNMWLLSAE